MGVTAGTVGNIRDSVNVIGSGANAASNAGANASAGGGNGGGAGGNASGSAVGAHANLAGNAGSSGAGGNLTSAGHNGDSGLTLGFAYQTTTFECIVEGTRVQFPTNEQEF
ncbi:hypothetical protein GM658_27575 [Pseudoduganella eburnea]|uniref:Uncharacterized protein n=1 Tax=Massilia eburnea TaxID=1776165 RepID=A0A6L6QPT7_9BURK|nr:hypothetical protein [Massilia eburnea]MTW14382.1 hypothetical protein [Massilia eburnea]